MFTKLNLKHILNEKRRNIMLAKTESSTRLKGYINSFKTLPKEQSMDLALSLKDLPEALVILANAGMFTVEVTTFPHKGNAHIFAQGSEFSMQRVLRALKEAKFVNQ
jgi:hypothetical protein